MNTSVGSPSINKIRETLFAKYSKEELIEKIIELGDRGVNLNQWLYNLTTEKTKILGRFNKNLLEFKKGERYYAWNETNELDEDLEDLLSDLELGVDDPKEGLILLKAFFECDQEIVESAHDFLETAFSETAINLFVKYSEKIEDKEWIYSIATELLEHDEYQVRNCLSENMHRYLPEKFLREKIKEFFSDQGKSMLHILTVQNIAKGLLDPDMLEAAYRHTNSWDLNHMNIELGETWLRAGNPKKAIIYLEKINSNSISNEKLLLEAYGLTKNNEKEKKLLWKIFKEHRTKDNFDNYLKCVGNDKYEEMLQNEIKVINVETKIVEHSVTFLLETNRVQEAESYLWERQDQLDEDDYYSLSSWAYSFEENGRYLISSKVFRALLDSILKRGYTKAYHHGVDYLMMLEAMNTKISGWKYIEPHLEYFNKIKKDHSRKSSFWELYRKTRKI